MHSKVVETLLSVAEAKGVQINTGTVKHRGQFTFRINVYGVTSAPTVLYDGTPEVLAHELGHYFDWCARPERFLPPFQYATLSSRLDLEMRAWDIGLHMLRSVGYDDWNTFEESRCIGLSFHYKLGRYLETLDKAVLDQQRAVGPHPSDDGASAADVPPAPSVGFSPTER